MTLEGFILEILTMLPAKLNPSMKSFQTTTIKCYSFIIYGML